LRRHSPRYAYASHGKKEYRYILLATKDSPGSVDFSDVQIVHKFAGLVTNNLDL